jgi:hypothetical protein
MRVGSEPPICPYCNAPLLIAENDTNGIQNKRNFEFQKVEIDGKKWYTVNCIKCHKLLSIFETSRT